MAWSSRLFVFNIKKHFETIGRFEKKKMGYSWSFEGLKAMINALFHQFEGTLIEVINNQTSNNTSEDQSEEYPSFTTLLTERTRESIGAIQGDLPALVVDQQKLYIRAPRGLAGYLNQSQRETQSHGFVLI